jgi:hypothetical protein
MPKSARATSAPHSASTVHGSVASAAKEVAWPRAVPRLRPSPARRSTSAMAPARMSRLHALLRPSSGPGSSGVPGMDRSAMPASRNPSAFGAPKASKASPT